MCYLDMVSKKASWLLSNISLFVRSVAKVKKFFGNKMNENVKCSKAVLQPSITAKNLLKFVWWCIFFRSRTWGSSRRSICQEMCLETQTWYILGKKMCTVLFRVNRISHTRTHPKEFNLLSTAVERLCVWFWAAAAELHEFSKRLKLCTIYWGRDKKRTSQNHISIIVESFMANCIQVCSAKSIIWRRRASATAS